MEIVSLHPLDLDVARRYVASLRSGEIDLAWRGWFTDRLLDDAARMGTGDELAANRVTLGMALALSHAGPLFVHQPFGLSFWEAHVDRPIGMLMRPPSRLFQDAGFDPAAVRAMPIRLDLQHGMMGGAYIPARLMDQAHALIEEHLERTVKRLVAAEYDPLPIVGLMHEAIAYARDHGLGLYEAMDVVGPDGLGVAGANVVWPDPKRLDQAFRDRIATYQKPPKRPGLIKRLLGRGTVSLVPNGRDPHG
jgi:hypothetical protein